MNVYLCCHIPLFCIIHHYNLLRSSGFSKGEYSFSQVNDQFVIKQIYSTKKDGREWYINMSNPKNDPEVTFTFNPRLTKQDDGLWKIKDDKIRINVDILNGSKEWKNVEIIGYVKIDSIINNRKGIITDIDWVSRTDQHNEKLPCH